MMISYGLLFSAFGDSLFVFADVSDAYFAVGMGSFMFAHLMYMSAFDSYSLGEIIKKPIQVIFAFHC